MYIIVFWIIIGWLFLLYEWICDVAITAADMRYYYYFSVDGRRKQIVMTQQNLKNNKNGIHTILYKEY